jgi:hypothetical protein
VRLDSAFLVLLFLASFSESLSTIFNYFFVFSGLLILIYFHDNITVPKSIKIILLFVLFIPTVQFLISGNYALRWIINFLFFSIGMIAVVTLIARMKYSSYVKFGTYLRRVVFLTLSVYIIYPVVDHGLVDIFLIDRNYLYSSANSMLPSEFLVKQKMSALVMFYIVIVWQMIGNCQHGLRRFFLYLLLLIAINMLLGSRSQMVGLFIATILVTAGNKINRIRIYSGITTSMYLILLYFMTSSSFMQFAALDIRVMLFHSAAVSFFDNIFSGIGLFYLPQYLDSNNYSFFSQFSFLYPETYKTLESYPMGFESSFMQLSLELGVVSIVILYFVTQGLLKVYSSIASEFRFFIFFVIAYVFSSLTEDNITQPSFYILIAILFGLVAYERTHLYDKLLKVKKSEPIRTVSYAFKASL